MKMTRMMLICGLLFPLLSTADQDSSSAETAAQIKASDFELLRGDDWAGLLKYRDYSSDREVSIPVRLRLLAVGQDTIHYRIEYPNEPTYDSDERITLTHHGRKLNGENVVSKTVTDDGTLRITTRQRGEDNGNKADILIIYQISPSTFSIQKQVRPDDAKEFFTRNTLLLSR